MVKQRETDRQTDRQKKRERGGRGQTHRIDNEDEG